MISLSNQDLTFLDISVYKSYSLAALRRCGIFARLLHNLTGLFMPHHISLAVIGTTSSGKSALINTFCGRFLMPVGVQETTLCVSEITHAPSQRTVDIISRGIMEQRKSFSSDYEARTYIENIHDQVKSVSNGHVTRNAVSCHFSSDFLNLKPLTWRKLLSRIRYQRPVKSAQSEITILDIPGYKYDGDEQHWKIMLTCLREHATIIFLFNAEETDSVKEDKLLRRLLTHQRNQGKSWRDICFVLNRCDALFRDSDEPFAFQKKRDALSARLSKHIRSIFTQEGRPNIYMLSSLPMMCGEILFWNYDTLAEDDKNHLLTQASLWVNQLLNDAKCEQFPRSAKKWTYRHVESYRHEMMHCTYYDSLLRGLEEYLSRQ